MTTVEQQAREAARKILYETANPLKYLFSPATEIVGMIEAAYLAAAEPREKKLRELRLLAESQLTVLRELKAAVLSDTRDAEIAELRARVAELEEWKGKVPVEAIRAINEWELGLEYPCTGDISDWLAGLAK